MLKTALDAPLSVDVALQLMAGAVQRGEFEEVSSTNRDGLPPVKDCIAIIVLCIFLAVKQGAVRRHARELGHCNQDRVC